MNESVSKNKTSARKLLQFVAKVTVTLICFWYISLKINFSEIATALQKANWWWLSFAIFFFALGKLFASFRLNIYFKNITLSISQFQNIKLYWLGMFYNLFLPGSISGDAYKVILLARKKIASYKKITTAVLLDRFSGLLALNLFLAVYGLIVLKNNNHIAFLFAIALGCICGLYIVVRYFLKDFLSGLFHTFIWGIAVQLMMLFAIYSIMLSLHLPLLQSEWVFIFLIASVVSVLPISLGGGLGTREVVFMSCANYFGIDMHIGIIISLLFYLSNLIASIGGLYFVFNDPLKEK